MKFNDLEVCQETIRTAIKKDLKFSYKKNYFRTYAANDLNLFKARRWLVFELMEKKYLEEYYMVFIDETSINNTSY